VERIFWGRVDIEAAFSELHFTPASSVRSILHNIKYHGDRGAATFMGRMMGRSMNSVHPFNEVDAIIPLPLHPKRLKHRGYNQAELLANGIAEVTGLPVRNDLLRRERMTHTQTRRSRLDRWGNVSSAFVADPATMTNARLLLVDDVVTTGATLEAAASALMKGSQRKLCIATLAWADK
jgi:ComF family protein